MRLKIFRRCPGAHPSGAPGREGARPGAAALLFMFALAVSGCGQSESEIPGTGKTVRQEKLKAAEGLGDYRSVEMPARARQNLVEADPNAPGAASYKASVFNR